MQKSVADFRNLIHSFSNPSPTNGFVYYLFTYVHNKSNSKTTKALIDIFQPDVNVKLLGVSISRAVKRVKSFKNFSKEWHNLTSFLGEDFKPSLRTPCHLPTSSHSHSGTSTQVTSACTPVTSSCTPSAVPGTFTCPPPSPPTLLPLPPTQQTLHGLSPVKTRRDIGCSRCRERKNYLANLLKRYKLLQRRVYAANRSTREVKKQFRVGKVNQSLSRKDNVIKKKNNEIKDLNSRLAKACSMPKEQILHIEKENSKLREKCNSHMKKIKVLEKAVKERDMYIDYISSLTDNESEDNIPTKKNNKQYHTNVRTLFYQCVANDVPFDKSADIVRSCVGLLTKHKIISLPSPATISQMCREIGILSELQVAEAMLEDGVCTLAFDATTINGDHINEIHIATQHRLLTASIDILPGGTADDYVQHIRECFDDVALSYSELKGLNKDYVLGKIKANVLSTLTDRASVNHAAVRKLGEEMGKDLLELNCHLHPLDGIANSVRTELKKCNVSGSSFGSDCQAANLLHAVSKLR